MSVCVCVCMYACMHACTRDVCKVRGLILLLRVGTLWRCDDGLFFEVPPLASGALLTTFHPLLENVLQTVDHFEISFLGAPFSWLEKPRNRMEVRSELNSMVGFEKVDQWNPIRTSAKQSRSRPMRFVYSRYSKILQIIPINAVVYTILRHILERGFT
jgi:hypothetical protein